jgi:uncharacterized tellurite resistance protein B-like protein
MSTEAKKLIERLISLYELGDCECSGLNRTNDPEVARQVCLRCQIQEKIGETKESEFNELREIVGQ